MNKEATITTSMLLFVIMVSVAGVCLSVSLVQNLHRQFCPHMQADYGGVVVFGNNFVVTDADPNAVVRLRD